MTLEVDSAAIRRSAQMVEQAAVAFDGSGPLDRSPVAGGSLGPSAAAQAVVTACAHGLSRAQEATRGLAERSRTMAGAMQTTAAMFDMADSVIGGVR